MPKTRSERRRQTQLSFSPLPASSPARAQQPEAIRERAAAVIITASLTPSRKRKLDDIFLPTSKSKKRKQDENPLPTPSASSKKDITSEITHRRKTRSFLAGGSTDSLDSSRKSKRSHRSRRPEYEISDDDSVSDMNRDQLSTPTKPPKSTQRKSSTPENSDSNLYEDRVSSKPRPSRPVLIESSDDEDEVIRRPVRSVRVRYSPEVSNKSDSSDELLWNDSNEESLKGRRSKRAAAATPSKTITRQDRDDLDEDLEFLDSTDTPTKTRHGASSQQNAKRKALDVLKRRRLKQHPAKAAPARANRRVIISDDEEPEESEEDPAEHEGDEYEQDLYEALQTNIFEVDDYDEDFVIDDGEDETLGEPVELPYEFSSYRTMKAEDLFKYAVDWMVQKKINPAFAMEDVVYRIAFERLDDFVKGMGGSKFHSSAWTSDFSKSLRSRPVLEHHRFLNSGLDRDRCDACNRSGHPATFEVRFTGNTYHPSSLEEDSEDEDDSDDEHVSSVPRPGKTYYIGKFCMQNARTAHALAHWRYHLNEWVVDYLKDEGYCSPEKIVKRDSWSTSKRQRYANKIVDAMEGAGEIRRLHRDFRTEIKTAQFANESRWDNSPP